MLLALSGYVGGHWVLFLGFTAPIAQPKLRNLNAAQYSTSLNFRCDEQRVLLRHKQTM